MSSFTLARQPASHLGAKSSIRNNYWWSRRARQTRWQVMAKGVDILRIRWLLGRLERRRSAIEHWARDGLNYLNTASTKRSRFCRLMPAQVLAPSWRKMRRVDTRNWTLARERT